MSVTGRPKTVTATRMKQIPLTRGKYALVDDRDYETLSRFRWHAINRSGWWYAAKGSAPNVEYMHRVIARPEGGLLVDHKDGDGLNNVRENLRVATHAQNMRNRKIQKNNTSGFKGVHLDCGKWRAKIKYNGQWTHLGLYLDPVQAARVYDAKAKELFGEFARPNFR